MTTTWTAITTTDGRAPAQALADRLEALEPEPTGVGVFEVEDGSGLFEVAAYFMEPPDAVRLAVLAKMEGARDFTVSEVPDEDWVAKVRRDLPPVEAGRFFVYGAHDADRVPEGAVHLRIEAAMAFGTGHHGTTLGCLMAYDALLNAGLVPRNVADIGAGTAVLAMAAARTSPNPVIASDIDPTAVEVARANAEANDLADRIRCVLAAGFNAQALSEAAPFDLIFANILKGPLVALAPDLARALSPGGHAILSGLLSEQADGVAEVYARQGLALVARRTHGEWDTLTLQKPA